MVAGQLSNLITRDPKQDLKVTKSRVLNEMVRFGLVSVTLSNAWGAKKCVGKHYTVYRLARLGLSIQAYKFIF